MKKAFLGLDTSNYRTSICAVDETGAVLFERKELLHVPAGERGLMQSEALFQHVKNLPRLFSSLAERYEWLAVGASTRPRPAEDSYMPVFLCGESVGRFCAALLKIPFFSCSHQEGHIAAAEYSLGRPIQGASFLAVHLSGGTSELLEVRRRQGGYRIERLGGTLDLHAGQFIDRIGVELGLPFPAGPELEKLARHAQGLFRTPSAVKGYDFSFSGPETALLRAIREGVEPAEVAWAAERTIANALEKVLRKALRERGLKEVLIVGGVAANRHIRARLKERLGHPAVGGKLYFASPEYSGDNAYGVACLALERYKNRTFGDL